MAKAPSFWLDFVFESAVTVRVIKRLNVARRAALASAALRASIATARRRILLRSSMSKNQGLYVSAPGFPSTSAPFSPPAASLGKLGACGEGADAEVRRQPRLSHESSMNVGEAAHPRPRRQPRDAPHPLPRQRRHARENVLDDNWGREGGGSRPYLSPLGPARRCASNVLAMALGREAGAGSAREPSTKHLCYSRESGYSSETSQHGAASFGSSIGSPFRSSSFGSSFGSLVRSRSLASLTSSPTSTEHVPSHHARTETHSCTTCLHRPAPTAHRQRRRRRP